MRTRTNLNHKFRKLMAVAVVEAFFLLVPQLVSAQAPLDQARSILEAGAVDKSSEQRVATMRVLQLVPRDAKSVALAETGLQDKDPGVRGAAALSLGAMKSKGSIPKLLALVKSDPEGGVVMAAAKSLIQLGEDEGYEVYFAVLTGQRKSGAGLVGSQEKEMSQLMHNPKQMETMAFEQGMGFVPFGGAGLQVYQTVHDGDSKDLIVKTTSIKVLAMDPDPRTGKALVDATTDKHWLVRSAAFDALARRDDPALLPDATLGLKDEKAEVKLTAAAAVIHLSTAPNKSAR